MHDSYARYHDIAVLFKVSFNTDHILSYLSTHQYTYTCNGICARLELTRLEMLSKNHYVRTSKQNKISQGVKKIIRIRINGKSSHPEGWQHCHAEWQC